jgi:hypothetical protein
MKEYTHAKGFNITSINGISGLYFFQDSEEKLVYIGMCVNDFKNRINSHDYGEHGKLSPDIDYLRVVIVDPVTNPLHVLEHLFIWFFNPKLNHSLWFFSGAKNEKEIKQIAKENNLHIQGSLKRFLLSFESVLIEREWENDSAYKRYGEIENIESKKVYCTGTNDCICYKCLINNRYLS